MVKILEECKKAVDIELRLDCRQEAMQILELASKKDCMEFLKYHKKNQGNICCLVLDFAKKKLVESGKMEYTVNECFHDPHKWLNDEKINKT